MLQFRNKYKSKVEISALPKSMQLLLLTLHLDFQQALHP